MFLIDAKGRFDAVVKTLPFKFHGFGMKGKSRSLNAGF
jgi:hypothetical protein